MRDEIRSLINRWDEFRDDCDRYEFSEEDVNTYSELMTASFQYLKEWKNKKVEKDVALLFATIGYFSCNTMDQDGNVLGNEEFERVVIFNMLFTNELFSKDYFDIDEQGMVLFDQGYDILRIDPSKFEIPALDDML